MRFLTKVTPSLHRLIATDCQEVLRLVLVHVHVDLISRYDFSRPSPAFGIALECVLITEHQNVIAARMISAISTRMILVLESE